MKVKDLEMKRLSWVILLGQCHHRALKPRTFLAVVRTRKDIERWVRPLMAGSLTLGPHARFGEWPLEA